MEITSNSHFFLKKWNSDNLFQALHKEVIKLRKEEIVKTKKDQKSDLLPKVRIKNQVNAKLDKLIDRLKPIQI